MPLDDTISAGQSGHIADHESIAVLLNSQFNVKDPDYGAVGDGSTDDTTAIQAALDAADAAGGGIVFFPLGDYKITTALTLYPGVTLQGVSYLASRIMVTGAIKGASYSAVSLTEADITLQNIGFVGTVASALDLLTFTNASGIYLYGVGLRNTSKSCLKLDGTYKTIVIGGRFEDHTEYGVNQVNAPNVGALIGVDFNVNTATGIAAVRLAGSSWEVRSCNIEGAGLTVTGIALASPTRCQIASNFMEAFDGHTIDAETGATVTNITIVNNHLSSGTTEQIDFSLATAASGIRIHNNGFRAMGVSTKCFVAGPTTDYEFLDNDRDPDVGTWVSDTGVTATVKNVVRRGDRVWVNGLPVTILGTGSFSSGTYTVTSGTFFQLTSVGTITALSGYDGQVVFLHFQDGGTTLTHGTNLRLNGQANITPTASDVIQLINVGSNVWLQVAPVSAN